MRQLRIRGFVIGALLLAVLAGVTGSVDAMQITEFEDLHGTVEATETEIADAQLDDIPGVPELNQEEFDALVSEIRRRPRIWPG